MIFIKKILLHKLFFLLVTLFIQHDTALAMKRSRSDSTTNLEQSPLKKQKKHECTICLRRFRLPYELKNHVRNHTGEKPYDCTECSKSFTTKANLKQHKETHAERLHFCHICNKGFTAKRIVNAHSKTCGKEKQLHPCNLCSQSYSTISGLHKHLTTHLKTNSGTKEHSCSICFRKFHHKYNLNKHTKHCQEKTCAKNNAEAMNAQHGLSNKKIETPLQYSHQNGILKDFCNDENFSQWYE